MLQTGSGLGSAISSLGVNIATLDIVGAPKFHDAAVTGINNNAGAYVEITPSAVIPAGTKQMQISSNMGEAVSISIADTFANAVTSLKKTNLVAGGAPGRIDVDSLLVTDRLWIRSLTGNALAVGQLTINFLG